MDIMFLIIRIIFAMNKRIFKKCSTSFVILRIKRLKNLRLISFLFEITLHVREW